MQRPLRELGRLLGSSSSGSASAASNNNTTDNTEFVVTEAQQQQQQQLSSSCEDSTTTPVVVTTGLPLLQVWPSDSPRAVPDDDNDETSAFVYPEAAQQQIQQQQQDDSGIDSIQRLAVATVTKLKASPTPTGVVSTTTCVVVNCSPSTTPGQSRRPSLLHPDHARIHGLHHHHHHHHHHHGGGHHHHHHHQPHHHHHHQHHDKNGRMSPDRGSILDGDADPADRPPSPSSSTTSSLKSMPSSAVTSTHSNERRRSSRYSMFDALDLEYALLRAAARGSVGPYSLSESLHKLTFTQSLAFPALARGLATKQTVAAKNAKRSLQQQHGETGMNAFAKVVTALVLVLVSVLVFGVVYKFVRT